MHNIEKEKAFQKIVICSDFLMTSDVEQRSNLPWLYDILHRPLKNSTSLKVENFCSSRDENCFDRTKFFKYSNIKFKNNKQFDFLPTNITNSSLDYLKKYLTVDTLIIGYELSPETRKVLSASGFRYIDIWLHPVRFLDDILFAFSANNKEVFHKLEKYNVSEETMYLYADRLKISTYKGFKRYKNLNLLDDSALFIGQTLEDKAILKDSIMLNITHFKREIDLLAKQHSVIYYSKHPHVKNDDAVMNFINNHPSIQLIDIPAYILLAQNEIKKVVSISSSVALEAKYFDKNVQILHKPVIDFTSDFNEQDYYTVMQDFISPHFWADILSPIISTNECQSVKFLDRKDKIRDMLSFYWSYRIVDKTEHMRIHLIAVDKKVQRVENDFKPLLPKVKKTKVKKTKVKKTKVKKTNVKSVEKTQPKSKRVAVQKTHCANPDLQWKKHTALINNSKIVSFDVFDTLLVRPLEHASDLFIFMEEKVRKLTNNKITDFKSVRLKARSLVEDGQCGEEVSLQERYDAISLNFNINKEITDEIMNFELELEKNISLKREYTNKLLAYAKNKNKKVIIVSDTFFSKEFVKELLDKNSITQYDDLIVSSDVGLLKHTGSVYPYLLRKFNISAKKILHIGDNAIADIAKAKEYNIQTIHIPRTIDEFNNKTGLAKTYKSKDYLSSSIIKGIIGNKVMDNPFNFSFPSHSNGNLEQFGFSILGPMFYGFSQWVLEEAKKLDIKTIYFLARDGEIVKKCYDIITKNDTSSPVSKYLYASRRAYSIPSIFTYEDIVDIASLNFSPTPLSKILKNRFGISINLFSKKLLKDSGFKSKNEIILSSQDLDRFLLLLEKHKDLILEHAKQERLVLQEYLMNEGLNANDKILVVDIGHNGTMQKRVSKILSNDHITGLYFVTQRGIDNNLVSENLCAKGYVANKINGGDTRYPYNKYLLMFEAVFLNTDTSFVSFFKEKDGTISNNFLPPDDKCEAARIEFIKGIQVGILDFQIELMKHKNLFLGIGSIYIDGRSSINPYLALLKHPYQLDVEMFNKVTFENKYSGRDHKHLVFYDKYNYQLSRRHTIWKDALDICEFKQSKILYLKNKVLSFFLLKK